MAKWKAPKNLDYRKGRIEGKGNIQDIADECDVCFKTVYNFENYKSSNKQVFVYYMTHFICPKIQ